MVPGVHLRHFSIVYAVHVEDCEGWWLSGCCGSVAEYWQLKPGALGSIPSSMSTFPTEPKCVTLVFFS